MEKDGRKGYITERNGRSSRERQGIVHFTHANGIDELYSKVCIEASRSAAIYN